MGRASEQAGLGSWRRENQQKAGGGGYWELLEIGPYPPPETGTRGTLSSRIGRNEGHISRTAFSFPRQEEKGGRRDRA